MVLVKVLSFVPKQLIGLVQNVCWENTKITLRTPVLPVKDVLLPVIIWVLNFLLVQQQQIERVQNVYRANIKILLLTKVLLVKHALLRVVLVPNSLLVQQQQIERVQLALQDQLIKIQHHIHLLHVNLVRYVPVAPQ